MLYGKESEDRSWGGARGVEKEEEEKELRGLMKWWYGGGTSLPFCYVPVFCASYLRELMF